MLGRGRKSEVTGWTIGTVKVTRIGRHKWSVEVRSPVTGDLIESGMLSNHDEKGARYWVQQRWKELEFLTRLQAALNSGRLSPDDYYRILGKYRQDKSGCKQNHTHSMNCKYHQH